MFLGGNLYIEVRATLYKPKWKKQLNRELGHGQLYGIPLSYLICLMCVLLQSMQTHITISIPFLKFGVPHMVYLVLIPSPSVYINHTIPLAALITSYPMNAVFFSLYCYSQYP